MRMPTVVHGDALPSHGTLKQSTPATLNSDGNRSSAAKADWPPFLEAELTRQVAAALQTLGRDRLQLMLEHGLQNFLEALFNGPEMAAVLERRRSGALAATIKVKSDEPDRAMDDENVDAPEPDWPGRREGLSARESEVIALITQGYTNKQVAERAFLSPNTIKSYVRSAYRKMGVDSRSQAVLWGLAHGFGPDRLQLGVRE